MNQNVIVLEISSDEDDMWTDDNTAGVSGDGDGDDHKWLTELLDEVNQVKNGEDEVIVANKSEKSGKKLKLNLKSSVVELEDDDDDCVVLENDPNETVDVSNDNRSNGGGGGGSGGDNDDSDEIVFVSEKGQVACRDYPHSRHLCIRFPFSTTPNQSHCEQCYCYVCDSLAPCIYWGNGSTTTDHCHATDKDELWRRKRKTAKNGTKPIQPLHKLFDPLKPQLSTEPARYHRPTSTPEPHLVHPRNHKSANFQTPSIIRKNRHPLFSSRHKFHPDLVSHYRKTNVASVRTQIQRPVVKNRDAVSRSSFGNQLNGMVSGPRLPPTAINAPNGLNLNRNFQSRVNFNAVGIQPPYRAPPPPPRTQPASSQPTYTVPNFAPKFSNGTRPQIPVTNPGFKEKAINSVTAQGSATNEVANGNGSSLLDVVPDELTSYDWMFDSDPVHGVYGLNDFSCDSGFIDPGPIFDW